MFQAAEAGTSRAFVRTCERPTDLAYAVNRGPGTRAQNFMAGTSAEGTANLAGDFETEQKRYLEGFMSGLQIARARVGLAETGKGAAAASPAAEPTGPEADHLRVQNRILKEGKTLSEPEKFKRELHPFDAYARLKSQAAANEP